MFSLTLVARHNASKKTFHVDIESLPSVSELLEGMGGYLEEKYDVQFPKIPTLFNACEDPPAADDDLPPFPTVALPPGAPLVEAPLSTIVHSFSRPRAPPSVRSFSSTGAPPFTTPPVPFSTSATASPSTKQSLLSEKPYMKKVACVFCGKELAKTNLARHIKIHADKSSWFKCDFFPCLYSTPRRDDLKRHRELNHLSR